MTNRFPSYAWRCNEEEKEQRFKNARDPLCVIEDYEAIYVAAAGGDMSNIDSAKEPKVPESLLAQIWKGQWIQKGPLFTSEGRKVIIRSPGIENKDSGPDFLSAAIVLDDKTYTGDIELHVKSSDWRAHGHHRDPHFNGVILQVVLWDDAKKPAQLQNGKLIQTLSLHDYLNGSMDEFAVRAQAHSVPFLACRGVGDQLDGNRLVEVLGICGEDRFCLKSAAFELELILEDPAQVLYWGIMGALGYTKNKQAFQDLARRLPIQVLESIAEDREPESRAVMIQAILLGAAGLLPSQCEGKSQLGGLEISSKLEENWRCFDIECTMNYADWHFFRMHPKNFPTQRLLAAGYLIDRYMGRGLLDGVSNLMDRAKLGKGTTLIEDGFVISGLIGRGRAREIVVNAILPFYFAWAEVNPQPKIKGHVLELYRTYPGLVENRITLYLSDLFWGRDKPKTAKSAKIQQGLIHLYKTFCHEQRCEDCPVGTLLVGISN